MDNLKHITLAQLIEVIKNDDDLLTNNYVSQNMVVARHLKPSLLKEVQSENESVIINEMRILVVKKGWSKAVVNLIERRIESGDLFFVAKNSIFQLKDVSENVEGFVLLVSDDIFNIALGNRIPKAFDGHNRDFQLKLSQKELDYLDEIHHLLHINTKADSNNPNVSLSLISAFLWQIDFLLDIQQKDTSKHLSREQRLFTDFIKLVNENTPNIRNIGFYASKLFVSQRYMSTLVKKTSGKTAKEWIDDAVITKMKIELSHTDKPINRISDNMDFPNVAFFCKYFKNFTGMTPLNYRKRTT